MCAHVAGRRSASIQPGKFLTLWKDADPDIPVFIAAKSEYAKFKGAAHVMLELRALDAQAWAGYLAGSGNPQRLPPSRENGSRACVARNHVSRNLEATISLPAQSASDTLDRVRVDQQLSTKNW